MIHHLIQVLVDSRKGRSTYLGAIEAHNARDTLARYLDIFNIPSEPAPFHDLIDLAMGAFKGIENGDLGSASGMRAAFVPLNNLTDTLATLAAAEEKEDEADSTTECFDDAVNEALNADHE
jgi:hypothetical protein